MALVIILNVVLAFGVIVMVISPLVWAILTQQRDAPEVRLRGGRSPLAAAKVPRGSQNPQYEPIVRPV